MLKKLNKKKILVIDNNPVLLKLMVNLLADQEGHQVKTAGNGLEALDVLQSFIPDVMFIDLIMPKIGGAELCRIIRSMPEFNNTGLVILSSIAKESQDNFPLLSDIFIAKGPFASTARNILLAMEYLDDNREHSTQEQLKLGFDDIFPREATAELLSWKAHFEIILNNISEAIFEITKDWRIIYVNPEGRQLLAAREEKILGISLPVFFQGSQKKRLEALLSGKDNAARKSNESDPFSINERQVTITCLPLQENGYESFIVMIHDITKHCQMEEKLRRISITDELTELLNRRGFLTMADKQFKIADRVKNALYLIFVDLDDLKKINDKYGHKTGDKALMMLADILRRSFRQPDIIGRLGGDEFAVLTTGELSGAKAERLCDRFTEALTRANMQSSLGFKVHISFGIAKYDPLTPCSLAELIARADFQMYQCKQNKKCKNSNKELVYES